MTLLLPRSMAQQPETQNPSTFRTGLAAARPLRQQLENNRRGDFVSTQNMRGRRFAATLTTGSALALEFDTGNPDLSLRCRRAGRLNGRFRPLA